ncbi:hypothetical protein QR680_011220 [Steinernema hermaphroditum]|uniref:RRM domain-containing protein n=1 Tax=Steinernema hermaphroditum TaxID=289476 RepID=A0AA39ISX7_9BILA|nr:hypothetical protein QR680_011220 [Steinernema hermaphroditum]
MSSPTDQQSEATLYVGTFLSVVHEDDLREYFEGIGRIVNVKVMKTTSGKSYAFVTFESRKVAEELLRSEHYILGQRVTVDWAAFGKKVSSPGGTAKIYIAGLPKEASEDDLKGYFKQFGPVLDVKVVNSKSIGFVTFASAEVVEELLKEEHQILGQHVEVKWSIRQDRPSSNGSSHPLCRLGPSRSSYKREKTSSNFKWDRKNKYGFHENTDDGGYAHKRRCDEMDWNADKVDQDGSSVNVRPVYPHKPKAVKNEAEKSERKFRYGYRSVRI